VLSAASLVYSTPNTPRISHILLPTHGTIDTEGRAHIRLRATVSEYEKSIIYAATPTLQHSCLGSLKGCARQRAKRSVTLLFTRSLPFSDTSELHLRS